MIEQPLDAAFAGRPAFQDAVRAVLAEAARRGCHELQCCDADFADWPLDDAAVLASLSAWARPQRRLTLLAANYDEVLRRLPRWVAWRRVWSHVVSCRRADEEIAAADVPTLLLVSECCSLRLLDRVRWRGVVSTVGTDLARARHEFDAISQRSSDAFGATTLGL